MVKNKAPRADGHWGCTVRARVRRHGGCERGLPDSASLHPGYDGYAGCWICNRGFRCLECTLPALAYHSQGSIGSTFTTFPLRRSMIAVRSSFLARTGKKARSSQPCPNVFDHAGQVRFGPGPFFAKLGERLRLGDDRGGAFVIGHGSIAGSWHRSTPLLTAVNNSRLAALSDRTAGRRRPAGVR